MIHAHKVKEMEITVTRKIFTDICTIGDLEINGKFESFVLEDMDRKLEDGNEKIKGLTAIPRGLYKVVIDFSSRFKRPMPHILDVPGFEGIRIHCGNTAANTEGCLLLGRSIAGANVIGDSRDAYAAFFEKLKASIDAGEEVTLEVK
jgi:hypothetical protein